MFTCIRLCHSIPAFDCVLKCKSKIAAHTIESSLCSKSIFNQTIISFRAHGFYDADSCAANTEANTFVVADDAAGAGAGAVGDDVLSVILQSRLVFATCTFSSFPLN